MLLDDLAKMSLTLNELLLSRDDDVLDDDLLAIDGSIAALLKNCELSMQR